MKKLLVFNIGDEESIAKINFSKGGFKILKKFIDIPWNDIEMFNKESQSKINASEYMVAIYLPDEQYKVDCFDLVFCESKRQLQLYLEEADYESEDNWIPFAIFTKGGKGISIENLQAME